MKRKRNNAFPNKNSSTGDSDVTPRIAQGHEFITRDGAELLMIDLLTAYEEKKVAPRHNETQGSIARLESALAELKDLVTKGQGVKEFFKFAFSLLGWALLVVQLIKGIKH